MTSFPERTDSTMPKGANDSCTASSISVLPTACKVMVVSE
jgi:hypothetical protein